MNQRKLWKLIAVTGLAATSLLLLFLLLGQITVGAAPGEHVTIADVQPFNASFSVSGTVTCAVTGPISDVMVNVWDRLKSTVVTSATTRHDGYYNVTTLEAGEYDLNFYPPCYSKCASQSFKGIKVPSSQTQNVTLMSGYSVSGTVSNKGGITPEGNVSIYAFNHDTADGFGLPLTDADWHYCIKLVEGPYDLGFTPPPCLGLGPHTEVITVNLDMTRNVTLPLGFTVAGRITVEASAPVSAVQIYARECYTWTGYGFSPSNENGHYTGTLPLGTFGIQFLPPAFRGLGPKTVTDVVSNTAGCPNTSLDVTLPQGFTISGQVTCQGEPVKNVFVYADPVGPSPDCYGLDGVGVYTVDDGSYGLPVISGTYDIKFDPPQATGFNTAITTDLQVITDTILDIDLCPLYLPIILKSYLPP